MDTLPASGQDFGINDAVLSVCGDFPCGFEFALQRLEVVVEFEELVLALVEQDVVWELV